MRIYFNNSTVDRLTLDESAVNALLNSYITDVITDEPIPIANILDEKTMKIRCVYKIEDGIKEKLTVYLCQVADTIFVDFIEVISEVNYKTIMRRSYKPFDELLEYCCQPPQVKSARNI
jgi:hypothetical protein